MYNEPWSGLRAFGWVITLPVSFGVSVATAVATDSKHWGAGVGAVVALFGLFVVSVGHGLNNGFGERCTMLMLLTAVPITAFTWAVTSGSAWKWAAGWVVLATVLTGISRGFMLHGSRSSSNSLLGDIVRGFLPGA